MYISQIYVHVSETPCVDTEKARNEWDLLLLKWACTQRAN